MTEIKSRPWPVFFASLAGPVLAALGTPWVGENDLVAVMLLSVLLACGASFLGFCDLFTMFRPAARWTLAGVLALNLNAAAWAAAGAAALQAGEVAEAVLRCRAYEDQERERIRLDRAPDPDLSSVVEYCREHRGLKAPASYYARLR